MEEVKKSKDQIKKEEKLVIRKKEVITTIAFIVSFVSIFLSTIIASLLIANNIFLINSYNYIHFIFIIIPIISIIVSVIYRYDDNKLKRNILLSIVVIILLISMGFNKSNFKENDYEEIFKYSDILKFELPEKGKIMVIDNTNVSYLYSVFDKDISSLISDNEYWLSASNLKSELTIFLNPLFTVGDKDNYFLIYNSTTDEYNKLPASSGEYEIVSCIYSKSKNTIEIDKFTYNYIG